MKLNDNTSRFLVILSLVLIIIAAFGILALVSDADEPEGYVQIGPIVFDVTTTTTSSPAMKIRDATTGLQIVKDAIGAVIDNTLTLWVTKGSVGSTGVLSATGQISTASGATVPGTGAFGAVTTGDFTATGDGNVGGTLGVTGIIISTTFQAQGAGGAFLVDDAGLGITVEDGGFVGIGTDNPAYLIDARLSTQQRTSFHAGYEDKGLYFIYHGDRNHMIAANWAYNDAGTGIAKSTEANTLQFYQGGLYYYVGVNQTVGSAVSTVAAFVVNASREFIVGDGTDAGAYEFQVQAGLDEIGNNWNTHVSGASDTIRNKWRKRNIRSATGEIVDRTLLHKLHRPMSRKWQYEPGYWQKSRLELDTALTSEVVGATREAKLDVLEAEESIKESNRVASGEYDVWYETLVAEETPDEFINFDSSGNAVSFKSRKIRAWLVREVNRLLNLEDKARDRIVTLENDLSTLTAAQQKKNSNFNARLDALEAHH